jgi:hypothetical protein
VYLISVLETCYSICASIFRWSPPCFNYTDSYEILPSSFYSPTSSYQKLSIPRYISRDRQIRVICQAVFTVCTHKARETRFLPLFRAGISFFIITSFEKVAAVFPPEFEIQSKARRKMCKKHAKRCRRSARCLYLNALCPCLFTCIILASRLGRRELG